MPLAGGIDRGNPWQSQHPDLVENSAQSQEMTI
jgi:hypothetical protein